MLNLKIASMKSDIRSHQITLEESKRNSLVQFEVKISNILVQLEESKRHGLVQLEDKKETSKEFSQDLKTIKLLVATMNRK